jgi:phosphomannomutase
MITKWFENCYNVHMQNKPKLNVSGYRGIWGDTLDENIVFSFVSAFVNIIKKKSGKKIIVGRDSRATGLKILAVIKYICKKENVFMVDVGIIPTPSVLLLVKKLKVDAGIIITASHNPEEYNGLKFVMKDGLFAGPDIIKEINAIK